jgi:hypothetical protein
MCAWASVSQFLPHNSATLQFQVLMSMQMDACLKKKQIGPLFVRGGAPEGVFWGGGVSGGSSPKILHSYTLFFWRLLEEVRFLHVRLYASYTAYIYIYICVYICVYIYMCVYKMTIYISHVYTGYTAYIYIYIYIFTYTGIPYTIHMYIQVIRHIYTYT